ncbi:MAG: leucine-rich repeat domain-containing protein [Eubacterium sp.]|nr:leucine-rich repeat domain-containing protein [Eubacterium sp.]
MNKKLFIICFTTILALSFCRTTDIKAALRDSDWNFKTTITKTESRLKYYAYPSKNGKEAWVYRISGNVDTKGTTLSIPKAIDGRKVTRIGDANLLADPNADERKNIISVTMEYWKKSSYSNQIKNVVIPDTVEVIEPCTFGGMPRVETIKIPKNVTKINEYTFYKCKRLKKVILPANLKELNPLAFYQCPNLKTLKLSPKNTAFKLKGKFLITRKDNALVYAAASGKALNIPNGIKTIKQNACNNVTAPVVHIPASVSTLEEDALTSLNIKDVTVAAGNKTFQKDGQCIYRKNDKSLAAAIADENLNLQISENIEKITTEYSVVNYDRWNYTYLHSTIFPKNLKSVRYPGFSKLSNAKTVYFTGLTPPKLTIPKNNKWMYLGLAKLPIFCDLYVPKDSIKAYKAWYKKYETNNGVKWHTFDGNIPKTETN